MHRLTSGPFRYRRYADIYLDAAKRYTEVPLKQAVISPSALSLIYPDQGIPGYPQEIFLDDLLREHESEIRRCLQKGAHKVQIDFTEGRLAIKIDPSGNLLQSFTDLNNLALARFSAEERKRIGVHTCPGADCDSTDSADVDYAELLPNLFELQVGNFYIALAGEKDRIHVLKIIFFALLDGWCSLDHVSARGSTLGGILADLLSRVQIDGEPEFSRLLKTQLSRLPAFDTLWTYVAPLRFESGKLTP